MCALDSHHQQGLRFLAFAIDNRASLLLVCDSFYGEAPEGSVKQV